MLLGFLIFHVDIDKPSIGTAFISLLDFLLTTISTWSWYTASALTLIHLSENPLIYSFLIKLDLLRADLRKLFYQSQIPCHFPIETLSLANFSSSQMDYLLDGAAGSLRKTYCTSKKTVLQGQTLTDGQLLNWQPEPLVIELLSCGTIFQS